MVLLELNSKYEGGEVLSGLLRLQCLTGVKATQVQQLHISFF